MAASSRLLLFLVLIPVIAFSPCVFSSPSSSSSDNNSISTIPNCNRICSSAGDQNNTKPRVPYPFGFSPGCEIQLNCSSTGEIKIGEFVVRNMTSDSILIDIPGNCNRSIRSLDQLFGRNYRMTTRNGLLLRNCRSIIRECTVPGKMLNTEFGNDTCISVDTMSCYSDAYNNVTFLNLDAIKKYGCGEIFSSIAFDSQSGWEMPLGPKLQSVELGWWLEGKSCKCSTNSKCVTVSLGGDGGVTGYRCQCMDGYVGDGFIAGDGCGKGPNAGTSKLRIIPLIAVPTCGVALIVVILVFFCNKRKLPLYKILSRLWKGKTDDHHHNNHDLEAILKKYGSVAPRRYNYSELKKMTNSFEIKLGQGGYGSVYKGKSQDGTGTPVAVKILTKESNKGNGEEFINEVVSISRTSHVNVVTLLGFCFQGHHKKALIYEFMENGSLDKFIYGQEKQLDWPTLYKIAVGIARGLEYLHRGCNTRILHFDIKPHNILLDRDFVPKISDFGLAKLVPGKENTSALSSLLTTVARGTIGYIAPEVIYRSIGGVSHKSDVYSYGMMVLEMVGGRKKNLVDVVKAGDEDRSSEIYFPDWIYKRLELDRGCDHQELGLSGMMLDDDDDEGGGEGNNNNNNNHNHNHNLVRKMIIVSLWCIQTHPSNRPTITNVLDMLEGPLEALRIPPKPFFSSPSRASSSSSSSSTVMPFSSVASGS